MDHKSKTEQPEMLESNPNPVLSAHFFSKLFFTWLNPLHQMGWKKDLSEEEIYDIVPTESSAYYMAKTNEIWEKKEKVKEKPSLLKSLLAIFGWRYVGFTILSFCGECMKMIQPYALSMVMSYILGVGNMTSFSAWAWVIALTLSSLAAIFFIVTGTQGASVIGMAMRSTVSTQIYQKVLRIGTEAFISTSTGNIVNLLSTDVEKFIIGVAVICNFIASSLVFIAIFSFIYVDNGWPTLAGLTVVVVVISIQLYLALTCGNLRKVIAAWTDKRIQMMSEIITGVKVIKMFCWEQPFHKLISSLRSKELNIVRKSTLIWSQLMSLAYIAPNLVTAAIFMCLIMTGQPTDPIKIIRLVGWCEVAKLTFVFLANTPHIIQDFLLLPEYARPLPSKDLNTSEDNGICNYGYSKDGEDGHSISSEVSVTIEATKMTAEWPREETTKRNHEMGTEEEMTSIMQMHIQDVSFTISSGELVAIIGTVGCGKTSLLMSILGELPIRSGTLSIRGTLVYVSEESWIFSDTVRENILFGMDMSQDWYNQVTSACALDKDIAQLPYGDLTLVGERGLSLSGGQKARLNLARAIYRNADIYLLDDPLSAVDTKVARHLFHRCILGILGNKMRILVTHQLSSLDLVDNILIMEKGRIVKSGTYHELKDGSYLRSVQSTQNNGPRQRLRRGSQTPRDEDNATIERIAKQADTIDEEDKARGTVSWSTYFNYAKSGSGQVLVPLFFLTAAIAQAASFTMSWWIISWSRQHSSSTNERTSLGRAGNQALTETDSLYVLIGLVAGAVLFGMVRAVILSFFTSMASRNLHNAMFAMIMRAPMHFFERTPVGRVLNRFSRDTGLIDETMPMTIYATTYFLVYMIGTLLSICIVNPWLILVSLPTAAILLFLREYSVRTTRSLKRIESARHSPVYSQVSATLEGIFTIRSFNMEEKLMHRFHRFQDQHTSALYLYIGANHWLGLRVDLTMVVFQTLVLITVMVLPKQELDSVLLSTSLVYTIGLFDTLQRIIRKTAELENEMTSVERILGYSRLEQEAAEHTSVIPPEYWPASGDLHFKHLSLQYRNTDGPALSDLNFTIEDKEKIGIVGRTGAGKTSLFTCLLRLAEPVGELFIDKINVLEIGLNDLRSKVSVIPQDPILFSGTIRYNLDPFSVYDDDRHWDALRKVQLEERVGCLGAGLDAPVREGGSNYSVGERQLLCLARAILQSNNILIVDEATANVDHRTDMLIQRAIREQFKDCTVITIAHRLDTVIDADRIMVMADGMVREFGHPHDLLQDTDGLFRQMARFTGDIQFEKLKEDAEKSHLRRRSTRNHLTTGIDHQHENDNISVTRV